MLRHNIVFLFGSLAVGFLNYAYYPILGRILAPTSFGEIQVLTSFLSQIIIFLNVLGLVTVNIVATINASEQRDRLIMELERLAFFLSLLLLAASVIAGVPLQHFFHFSSALSFMLLALAIASTVPLTFRSAYLRGRRLFGFAVLVSLLGSIADLVLALIFVARGLSVNGAMIGLVGGQLIAFAAAAFLARKYGFRESLHATLKRLPDWKLLRPELTYAGIVLVCSLAITVFYSVDVLVVKHYFDVRTAGLYAGIATVARIIFFATASITQVLLPSVTTSQTKTQNRHVLFVSLLLLGLVGGIALVGFAAFPSMIVTALMGHQYNTYASILPKLGGALFLISLFNLLTMYQLALRRYSVAVVVILGSACALVLLAVNHASITAIVNSLLFGCVIMLALFVMWASRLLPMLAIERRLWFWRNNLYQ